MKYARPRIQRASLVAHMIVKPSIVVCLNCDEQ